MDTKAPEQTGNEFTRNSLKKCFDLLRDTCPSLALVIQNVLMESSERFPESSIKLQLEASTVTEIVKKLAEIGEAAASDKATMKTELVKIRDVLMTWMVYAQNFPEQK